MVFVRRAPLLQFSSVAASACSVVFAKLFLTSLSIAQFLLIFAVVSVALCAPLVDKASLRLFLACRTGWLAIASNTAGLTAFYFGLAGLDPGTHAFLSRTYIAFGFVLSPLLFRESLSGARLLAAVLCVASALLTAAPPQMIVEEWLAPAATILAAGMFALNFALLRMTPAAAAPATPIVVYNAALIPLALSQIDVASVASIPLPDLGAAVVSSVLSVLSLYWYVLSARGVTFFASTALRAASPFLVAVMALPWFPMTLTPVNLIGVLSMPCVLIGIAVLEHRTAQGEQATATVSPRL